MKMLKIASVFLVALLLLAILAPGTVAGQTADDTITITIDRKVMGQTIFHPGRRFTPSETLTVSDYAIRDYTGKLIEGFIVQTSSGRTKIPVSSVKEIRISKWISRCTDDIELVENVAEAEFDLTDGSTHALLMNADFGTIEGQVEDDSFFLPDPLTVRRLVFNRAEKAPEPKPEPPKVVKVAEPAPPADSDGDGVPDSKDKCPNTPKGVKVDEDGCPPDSDGDGVADYEDRCSDTPTGAPVNAVGCWTIRGINFDYNKWDIKPQYHESLNENVRVLEMNPTFEIQIQGHTDGVGSQSFNLPLSEKRAESTEAYFVSEGINAERISTRGFGKLSPVAPNNTAEGRAQNRRIEIKILSR